MKPQFITDDKGNKVAVILSIKDYAKLLDEVDESHIVRMYDKAKSKKLTFLPFKEALKNIEQKKSKRKII